MSKKRTKKQQRKRVVKPVKKTAASSGVDVNIKDQSGRKKVLHIGCGQYQEGRIHERFHDTSEWREVRMDIDPEVEPDIVGDMLDMHMVKDRSMDAVYSSHNVEHVYPHQVKKALGEFYRVLDFGGFALVTLPDIQMVARYVAEGNLEGKLYDSPSGPICALDIFYGHIKSVERGNEFMAHKTAFTAQTLGLHMRKAGFCNIRVQRQYREWDLLALGYKLADDHPRRTNSITIIDSECGKSGMRDDLDMPPKRWKPLGLKQIAG